MLGTSGGGQLWQLGFFKVGPDLLLMAEIWLTTWDGAETLEIMGKTTVPSTGAGFQSSTISFSRVILIFFW